MYRSPIRLAGLEPATSYDKQALSLAKKKMLAELELGDGHAIVVDGTELNRQDIIRLFDELGNEQRLQFHLAISNDPALAHFLETGTLPASKPYSWQQNELYDTPAFRSFVSPYFAAALSAFLQKILSGQLAGNMLGLLLRQPLLLQPADHDTAYAKVTRHFLEIKNRILVCLQRIEEPEKPAEDYYTEPGREQKPAMITVTKEEISNLCSAHDIFILNRLPEEFDDLRHTLASSFNNICVACDHAQRYQLAYAAVCKAAEINCPALQELIENNKSVVYSKLHPRTFSNPPQRRRQADDNPLRWVGIVAFAIITFIRLANLGSCNSHSSVNYQVNYPENFTEAGFRNNDEQINNMATYRNLLAALYDVSMDSDSDTDTDHDIHYERDSATALLKGTKNGMDIFRDTWEKLGLKTTDSMPDQGSEWCDIRIRNNSAWPAVVMYALDETYFSSVYVRPHSSYKLRYQAKEIYADVYSGTNWTDTALTEVRRSLGHHFTSTEILKGKFGTHSGFIHSVQNSFFYRIPDSSVYHDSIIIENDPAKGTKFISIQNTPA